MTDRTTTPRGFAVYDEFDDIYGATIRVQKSSLATDDCVWIFASNDREPLRAEYRERLAAAGFRTDQQLAELTAMLEPSPHLNVEQAKRLVAALGEFIAEHEPRTDGERA